MNVIKRLLILATIACSTPLCHGEDTGFARHLLPLLENHCFECHGNDQKKGDLSLHNLSRDVINGGDEATWAVVLDQLNSAEMPPRKKKETPRREASRRDQLAVRGTGQGRGRSKDQGPPHHPASPEPP